MFNLVCHTKILDLANQNEVDRKHWDMTSFHGIYAIITRFLEDNGSTGIRWDSYGTGGIP